MGKKVTIFGSFVVNLMGRTPHLPAAGETMKETVLKMGPGGKGFNQGMTAHKAGADVTMVTKLGQNAFVDIALNTMSGPHMDTRRVLYSETTETGRTLITADENSSQSEVVVILGTCNTITDQEVDSLEDLVGQSEYLLTQLETNISSVERTVDIAHRKGVKAVLNTAPIRPVSNELLGRIDLITPNEMEAETLTGIRTDSGEAADKAVNWFFPKGVRNVLITLGRGGVYMNAGKRKGIIPAYEVDVVDTTGAGDAFNGGPLTALAERKDLREAVDFANALAALPVQKIGTTPPAPVREEVDAFMAADH